MKRSEMVTLIATILCIPRVEPNVDTIASDILDAVQANGMLPPRTMLVPMNLEDNAWDPETPYQPPEK